MSYTFRTAKETQKIQKRLMIAGYLNILHGVVGSLFWVFFRLLVYVDVVNLDQFASDEIRKNFYMMLQLIIVVLGLAAAVYSMIARNRENQMMFMLAFSIAGLDSFFLAFTGALPIIVVASAIIGMKIVNMSNQVSSVENNDFGGRASALTQKKSTASIVDDMNKNE